MKDNDTEDVARGIIYNNGKILLCYNLAGKHYFLPGGHIKVNELPVDTFKREIKEEIDCSLEKIESLLKTEACYFDAENNSHNQLCYIFLAKLLDCNNIISREDEYRYDWLSLEELKTASFKPEESKEDILNTIENNKVFWD